MAYLVKTRREGHSIVITIPHNYCRELGILAGDYLTLRPDHQGHLVIGTAEEYYRARADAQQYPSRSD